MIRYGQCPVNCQLNIVMSIEYVAGVTHAGVFMAMSMVGPAAAFVFGAMMLEVSSDFYSVSNEE